MLRIFQRATRTRRARMKERVLEADQLDENGYPSRAREIHEQLLEKDPRHAASLRRLAILTQEAGEPDRAASLWARLQELHPERADASLQLARLRLRSGDADGALSWAERAATLAEPGEPHAIHHRAVSLRNHLRRGRQPLQARHIAIGGMSFCGSTLLGYLLGSLPEVANVGESHAIAYRRQGMKPIPVDYATDEPEGMIRCTHCAEAACSVWTLPFRRALASDPLDWYGKLGHQSGHPNLVSSDKSHAKLSGLDPFGRHDLLVLFKTPTVAFASARRRPRPPKDPDLYMARWEREYGRLLHDLPIEGRRVVMHFDAFRLRPEAHFRRLLEILGLPIPSDRDLLAVQAAQHVIGGNPFTRQDVRAQGRELSIRGGDSHELPDEHAQRLQEREARSEVLRDMAQAHQIDFASC